MLSVLHMDGLGSVRAVTNAPGLRTETALYRPYGEQQEQTYTALLNESRGYIGERYDADAGLQYLNARYYDPRLGMFLQPDWWEVMQKGVGTNRYSYSFNDPVNGRDPTGHDSVGYEGYYRTYPTIPENVWTENRFLRGLDNTLRAIGNAPISAGNLFADAVYAVGETIAPYDDALTNFAVTTPTGFDDIAAGIAGKWGKLSVAAGARSRLTGKVQHVTESMSERARAYQSRVAGMAPGTAFVQNGVKFDGVDLASGALLEAKYGMNFMVETASGKFKNWAKFPKSAVEQARRQLKAANGARVEWRVSEESVAKALRDIFKRERLDIKVKVVK